MNLLKDDVFRVRLVSGETRLSLPGLISAHARREVYSITGIQRHQEDAFHVFLCYLAAALLARSGGGLERLEDEDFIRKGLRSFAGDCGDDAWELIVESLDRPAFMQPPILSNAENLVRRKEIRTPDALDIIQTSKNHDVKTSRSTNPDIDTWIYALITYQTMSGYLGAGHYEISRMNSGYGSRPFVEVVHSFNLGERFCDAVVRLLSHRQDVLKGPWGFNDHGLILVWTEPWDGSSSLSLKGLDPFYIEISRIVRLFDSGGKIIAKTLPTKKPRINAKEFKGNVGDAWIPIETSREDPQALTVGPSGITVDLLRRVILSEDFQLTALQRPVSNKEGDVWLSFSVLVRGQGKTEGYHEKIVPIPNRIRKALFSNDTQIRSRFLHLGRQGIEYAGTMSRNVLKPALFSFIEGAPEKIDFRDENLNQWWRKVSEKYEWGWSEEYFPWLWSAIDETDDEIVLKNWASILRDVAFDVWKFASEAMPKKSSRYWKSLAFGERVFWGALYNNFPLLKEGKNEWIESGEN